MLALAFVISASLAGDQFTVGHGGFLRHIEVVDGRLHTTCITEPADPQPRRLRTTGPEFLLTYGSGETVTSDDFQVKSVEPAAGGLIAVLEDETIGLRAKIVYSAAQPKSWLYKQITFTNIGEKPFLLRTVEVEHLSVTDESVTYAVDPSFPALGDWGQPVFTESLWFGLEFPAAHASATADGVIFLRHYPGIEIAPGKSYTTKRAVVGAATPGAVEQAFMHYVATLTPLPDPPRANIYWNGFRVIKPPNRTEQGIKMVEYAKKLKAETGFTFDGWSYDAGFDMYRPDALFVPNEADIWDKTRAALEPVGTPLGFWTSFSCIFDTPSHAWGKTQGYELQHKAAYCLAGPKYFAAMKERLEDIVKTYGMNAINFDGMYWGQGFGCNEPGHGHLVGEGPEAGVYATERVVENKLAIFESLRKINPKIILDLFVCNEWASPWWLTQLDGVHTVVGDTLGCDIPSPWLRDELITVRDIQEFNERRQLKRQFPLWAEDLYGTQVRRDHLIDGVEVEGEDMAARWEDEFTMALAGRGAVANHIVCCDLETIDHSRGGLKFLGEAGQWVRRNEKLYRDFHLIGGDPAKRQPYGYAHTSEGHTLVALRNPWIEPRMFELLLDESIGRSRREGEKYVVTILYPYRQTYQTPMPYGAKVAVPLTDYQVLLAEVRAESRMPEDWPQAAQWKVDEAGHVVTYDASKSAKEPSGYLHTEVRPGKVLLLGSIDVPPTARGQIQLFIKSEQGRPGKPAVRVDGQESACAIHLRTRDKGQSDAWALIDVPEGAHTIEVAVDGRGPISVGGWLIATYKLPATVTDAKFAEAEQLYPVFAPDETRKVATLLSQSKFTLPMGPLPEGASVFVSDLPYRCIESKVGFLQVGWDQSGWPEDQKLRIADKEYSKGIGVHAPSTLTFDIDGAFEQFEAEAGCHPIPVEKKADKAKHGSCTFVVEGDGKKLYESPILREGDAPLPVKVLIHGVKKLTLRTTDAGDGNWDDLGTWGNAKISK